MRVEYIFLVNPNITNDEQRAEENILSFYPHETNINTQLMHVGFCSAVLQLQGRFRASKNIINSTSTLSNDDSFNLQLTNNNNNKEEEEDIVERWRQSSVMSITLHDRRITIIIIESLYYIAVITRREDWDKSIYNNNNNKKEEKVQSQPPYASSFNNLNKNYHSLSLLDDDDDNINNDEDDDDVEEIILRQVGNIYKLLCMRFNGLHHLIHILLSNDENNNNNNNNINKDRLHIWREEVSTALQIHLIIPLIEVLDDSILFNSNSFNFYSYFDRRKFLNFSSSLATFKGILRPIPSAVNFLLYARTVHQLLLSNPGVLIACIVTSFEINNNNNNNNKEEVMLFSSLPNISETETFMQLLYQSNIHKSKYYKGNDSKLSLKDLPTEVFIKSEIFSLFFEECTLLKENEIITFWFFTTPTYLCVPSLLSGLQDSIQSILRLGGFNILIDLKESSDITDNFSVMESTIVKTTLEDKISYESNNLTPTREYSPNIMYSVSKPSNNISLSSPNVFNNEETTNNIISSLSQSSIHSYQNQNNNYLNLLLNRQNRSSHCRPEKFISISRRPLPSSKLRGRLTFVHYEDQRNKKIISTLLEKSLYLGNNKCLNSLSSCVKCEEIKNNRASLLSSSSLSFNSRRRYSIFCGEKEKNKDLLNLTNSLNFNLTSNSSSSSSSHGVIDVNNMKELNNTQRECNSSPLISSINSEKIQFALKCLSRIRHINSSLLIQNKKEYKEMSLFINCDDKNWVWSYICGEREIYGIVNTDKISLRDLIETINETNRAAFSNVLSFFFL